MNGREWVCDFHEYLTHDAESSGRIGDWLESPAFYHAKHIARTISDEHTPAMLVGSAIHCLALEGADVFAERFAIGPNDDRRTKAWKEFDDEADATGRSSLTASQGRTVKACREALLKHPDVRRMLVEWDGVSELSGRWTDDATGLPCKLRYDRLLSSHSSVLELKTSKSARPDAVQRTAATQGFHRRWAWYCEGHREVYGAAPRAMIFVTVSTEPPHEVMAWTFDSNAEELGARECRSALDGIARARESGVWLAPWQQQIQTISLPSWAARAAEQDQT